MRPFVAALLALAMYSTSAVGQESGFLEGPVAITNTHSVGVVRDAILRWRVGTPGMQPWGLPVVAETWDGRLNDINGFHVTAEHTIAALDGARRELRVAGVPVGEEIPDLLPGRPNGPADDDAGAGSIIVVVATGAPLLPHQLKRVATRVALGVGRTGGRGENSSGDIFVAFSTANPGAAAEGGVRRVEMLPNGRMNAVFAATVQATEEAIVNALLAATTMTGADDVTVHAIPHDRLLAIMRKYGRLR